MSLILTTSQLKQIQAEGSQTYPNECCGILIGREIAADRRVEGLVPMQNVFDPAQQRRRFAVDPLALMKAEKAAAAAGQVVLGFYHSHPDHPARPSEFDRQHAWPFYSYIIIAIAAARPGEMTSWRLNDATGQFDAETIEVESE